MKKTALIIVIALMSSYTSPADGYAVQKNQPFKKKLTLIEQLLISRPTQQDLLLQVADDTSINLSQTVYLLLSGYAAYMFFWAIGERYSSYTFDDWIDNIKEERHGWFLITFIYAISTYKALNAERILPIIIDSKEI